MNIARIAAATSLVVNIEVASPDWIAANADPDGPFLFVPYDDTNPAVIGRGWDPIGGFDPDPRQDSYTLTATELVDLGVTELVTVTPAELDRLVDERSVERLEADVAAAAVDVKAASRAEPA